MQITLIWKHGILFDHFLEFVSNLDIVCNYELIIWINTDLQLYSWLNWPEANMNIANDDVSDIRCYCQHSQPASQTHHRRHIRIQSVGLCSRELKVKATTYYTRTEILLNAANLPDFFLFLSKIIISRRWSVACFMRSFSRTRHLFKVRSVTIRSFEDNFDVILQFVEPQDQYHNLFIK